MATRTSKQLPPRERLIVEKTMAGLTGDISADLLRVRYSLMLIYRETDFSDAAHNRRALAWGAGIMPTPSTMGGDNAK